MMTLTVQEISTDTETVKFKEPLTFKVEYHKDCYRKGIFRKVGCYIVEIENDIIYEWADGQTIEEALKNMAIAFTMLYKVYALEKDENLHPNALPLKNWLLENVTIEKVEA